MTNVNEPLKWLKKQDNGFAIYADGETAFEKLSKRDEFGFIYIATPNGTYLKFSPL